ncbi:MAG: metal ABC transporter substrate-binding protein [Halioglobus sp.]
MMARFYLFLVVILCCAGCGDEEVSESNQRSVDGAVPVVVAVNYPVAFMAQRIAGDWLKVEMPVPADVDPAYWEPSVEQVVAVQQATLILLNGAGYASWIEKVSLPQEKLINTAAGFGEELLPLESVVTHTHGLAGEHAHAGYAFTTWLDLEQARAQATAVLEALIHLSPERRAELGENYNALAAEFQQLDQRWQLVGASLAKDGVVFSHPVYQYWQRRYQVSGPSVHWEPDLDPGDREWRDLDILLAENPIRWMIWEAEPMPGVRAALAKRGVESLVLPTVSNRHAGCDMMAVLLDATSLIERSL